MTGATLFDWLAQKPKYSIVLEGYVAENLELFHDTSDFAYLSGLHNGQCSNIYYC